METMELKNEPTQRMVIRVPKENARAFRIRAAEEGLSINLVLNTLIMNWNTEKKPDRWEPSG
jgi:predicted HicB family RNase H-like nuclease